MTRTFAAKDVLTFVLFFSFLVLLSHSALAQTKVEGEIYFKSDTIQATLKIPMNYGLQRPEYHNMQHRLVYFDSSGKKVKMKPKDALGFSFDHDGKRITMLTKIAGKGMSFLAKKNQPIFLKSLSEGSVKLFKYYYDASLDNEVERIVSRYVLQRNDGELLKVRNSFFKKDLLAFFIDCPEVLKKINNGEYNKKKMKALVRFANENCQ